MSGFLEKKDRLITLHPDMSKIMVHKIILRRFGGDLEHAIRRRFIEPFSTEDYINSIEEITTRTRIGRNWYKPPIDIKTNGKPFQDEKNRKTEVLSNVINVEAHLIWLAHFQIKQEFM
ncbi:hypothetical protein O181_064095 [Austropuccinia psidii MF-1]|uniref:Uncharacterized protein n=1 Tax=Austropuccinia psidii MF-1 TaxID=1389203 RepID=A0A9Q3I2S6_9BASI|nr:hypothetical protein [Austropuccinia psidii MF-1]